MVKHLFPGGVNKAEQQVSSSNVTWKNRFHRNHPSKCAKEVGGFLLHELLTQTKAHIHCLVREHTPIDARYKLERYLTQCQIPWQSFGDRIHVNFLL